MTLLTGAEHARFANDFHRVHSPVAGIIVWLRLLSDKLDNTEAAFSKGLDRLIIIVTGCDSALSLGQGSCSAGFHDPSLTQMIRFIAEELASIHFLLIERHHITCVPQLAFQEVEARTALARFGEEVVVVRFEEDFGRGYFLCSDDCRSEGQLIFSFLNGA